MRGDPEDRSECSGLIKTLYRNSDTYSEVKEKTVFSDDIFIASQAPSPQVSGDGWSRIVDAEFVKSGCIYEITSK
jgi:hypothetical protein